VQQHDPFFHSEASWRLVDEPREPGDSWNDIQRRHLEWIRTAEKTYQDHQLDERRERVRTVEQLSDNLARSTGFGNIRDNQPPYTFRRLNTGEVAMTDSFFRSVTDGFSQACHLAKCLTTSAVRRMLLEMDPGIRRIVLGPEIALARNPDHPRRLQRMAQEEDETDAGFALRVAKRSLALEMYPPTRTRRAEPDDTTESEDEGSGANEAQGYPEPELEDEDVPPGEGDEDLREPNLEWATEDDYEDSEDGESEEAEQEEDPRPPVRANRPILSGTPYEEGSEDDQGLPRMA
jgi:hypothetical protein